MGDSQLVRTVRMLLRSYRTKYYEFRVESLGLEEGGQQGKPPGAGGKEGDEEGGGFRVGG